MKFKQTVSSPKQPIRVAPAVRKLAGLDMARAVELHILDGAVLVGKAEMTVMDLVNLVVSMNSLSTDWLVKLAATCGPCDGCGGCEAFCDFEPVKLPGFILEEAGLSPDCKLEAFVDDDGNITVDEADYAHDLTDMPPEMIEVLRKCGLCIRDLDERLMADDIVYKDKGASDA